MLTLVFAGASVSRVIDDIQHAPGSSIEHQHLAFSATTVSTDLADDHHTPETGDEDRADHLPGSHHHHGDNSPGGLLTGLSNSTLFVMSDQRHPLAPDNQTTGLRIPGPERPPKASLLNA